MCKQIYFKMFVYGYYLVGFVCFKVVQFSILVNFLNKVFIVQFVLYKIDKIESWFFLIVYVVLI